MIRYPVAVPFFPQEDIDIICSQISRLLAGEGLLTMGDNVRALEEEFANYVGTKFAVATNSCTSALEAALYALGIGEGDEVIVPCQTFIATGSAVAISGARPVFAEVDDDFQLDFEDVKQKITPKTKAVIIVHFAGKISSDVFELRDFLKERKIALIEDCAHAHGASLAGKMAGAIGDVGCFSFYSTKIMTTGEGGMLTTSDEDIYEKASSFRNRGRDVRASSEIYCRLGRNARMSEIQAILGRHQLRRLDEFVERRNFLAQRYKDNLKRLEERIGLRYQRLSEGLKHAYWRFVVFLPYEVSRDRVIPKMRARSIMADSPYQPLLHLQPVFRDMFGIEAGFLPKSEKLASTHICLPMHCGLKDEDVDFISEIFIETIEEML